MGKMLDNFRAWWNSVADALGDPGKLAQLSVADLERAVLKAKEAAAPVVGRPEALEDSIEDLTEVDAVLTSRIVALINSGDVGQEAARKYVAVRWRCASNWKRPRKRTRTPLGGDRMDEQDPGPGARALFPPQ